MPNKDHHVGRVRPPKERRLAVLGVEALGPDEVSAKPRVRLRREVLALIEGMTPTQRGEALVVGLRALGLLEEVEDEAARRRLASTLGVDVHTPVSDDKLRFISDALELRVFDLLESDDTDAMRAAAAEAFQVARALPLPDKPLQKASELVRIGCLGVLGDRIPDVRRLLLTFNTQSLYHDSANWGDEVSATVLDIWIRLLRKQGWEDLDGVQSGIAKLRAKQREREPDFLEEAERRKDARPAWELMSQYHLAKAAEILGMYLVQGSVEGRYDVREQLEAQFDRAIKTASKGQLMECETFARLLARTARAMVDNSIWTVTRAVNSRVTKFVESVVSRDRKQPITK